MNTKNATKYWELVSLTSEIIKEIIPMSERLSTYMEEMNKLLGEE